MISTYAAVRILFIAYLVLGALTVYGAVIWLVRRAVFRRFSGYPPEGVRAYAAVLRRTIRLMRPVLILGPLCLFLAPLVLELYGGIPILHPLIIATLLYLNLVEAYAFRVWLAARRSPRVSGLSFTPRRRCLTTR